MNPFDVYQFNHALRLHFTKSKFDFFKVDWTRLKSCQPKHFDNLTEFGQLAYKEISHMKEPKSYLIGNYIFNPVKYFKHFNSEYYMIYRRTNLNGSYILQQDLLLFKDKFADNFTVDPDQIPHIVMLYAKGKISLYTLCVMENLTRWVQKASRNILTEDILQQVSKTHNFFKVDLNESKKVIIDRYK